MAKTRLRPAATGRGSASWRAWIGSFGLAAVLAAPAAAQPDPFPDDSLLAASILEELVGIRSLSSSQATFEAAEAMATRLREAGFPEEDVAVVGPPGVGNLVARYRGTGEKPPILLMAHLDVVDARREEWSVEPFELTERDGWWYGRGTTDNKAGAAILVTNLIRYREEGFEPDRDLVVVLTGDEETSSASIRWFVAGESRSWIGDPAFALNTDAGNAVLVEGEEAMHGVQTSEKVYFTVRLETTGPGGHSSRPTPDNAIHDLARGLVRLAGHAWPVELNETTRMFLARSAALESDPVVAEAMRRVAESDPHDPDDIALLVRSPYYNALVRTTCVATRLEAGHADNALPQSARATVNCRLLPGTDPAAVEAELARVIGDPGVRISRVNEPTASPPSPLSPEILDPIERLTERFWPGVPVVPVMSTGATDGLYVRNAGIPVYGVAAIFEDQDDVRAHGRDERIEIRRFYEALAFWYDLVGTLAR